MTHRERYVKDENYRLRRIAASRKHHLSCLQFPEYRELRRVRNQICNIRDSLEDRRAHIKRLQSKLKRYIIKKEILELAWGKVRSELKRRKRGDILV